jgi:hypothetical protein
MKSRLVVAAMLLAATAACNRGDNANDMATPANGQAAAPASAGAEIAAFAEYDRLCADLSDVAALNAAAPGAGWESYTPGSNETLDQLIALADRMAAETPGAGNLSNTAYRKNANGRELHAIVSSLTGGAASANECRVYDFAATAAPSAEAIAAWTSARPTSNMNQSGVTSWEWAPGFRSGLDHQAVIFVATDSPLRQQIPAVGLGITATKAGAPAAGTQAPAAKNQAASADTE